MSIFLYQSTNATFSSSIPWGPNTLPVAIRLHSHHHSSREVHKLLFQKFCHTWATIVWSGLFALQDILLLIYSCRRLWRVYSLTHGKSFGIPYVVTLLIPLYVVKEKGGINYVHPYGIHVFLQDENNFREITSWVSISLLFCFQSALYNLRCFLVHAL